MKPAESRSDDGPVPLEIDHVFVWVSRNAPEAEVVAEAGLRLDPETAEHTGQGTASVFFSFENAYLELVWVADPANAAPETAARSRWRENAASPFGVGLRRTHAASPSIPFPTRSQTADWMPAGESIQMSESSADIAEPFIFVIPPAMAVRPVEELSDEDRQALDHPLGAKRLTGVRIHVDPASPPSPTAEMLAAGGVLDVVAGEAPLLDLVFDEGRTGETKDLRPHLPLRLHW